MAVKHKQAQASLHLFGLDCFYYFVHYKTTKTQNKIIGIAGRLKHKQKGEKQQIECKVRQLQIPRRWRSVASCRLLLRTLVSKTFDLQPT